MATALRDGTSASNDDLERFSERLDEQIEREGNLRFNDHKRVALETREAIVLLINMAVNESGISTEIPSLRAPVPISANSLVGR